MSTFTTPLEVAVLTKNRFRVITEFKYYTHDGSELEHWFKVPLNFETDFASVPRVLWWFISPIDNHAKAAVLHDYLYASHKVSREMADDIFLEAMTVLRVRPIKRFIMYYGVRLFGWIYWNKKSTV